MIRILFTSLWGATWRIAGISWGNYFVSTSNSILAAQIPEARLMANFLFTARILEFVKNIAYVPFYSNIPEIYSLGAKKEFGLLKKRFSEYFVTATAILLSAYLIINVLGNPILHLFGISTEFMGILFITIMCMSIFFDMHSSFHSSVYASTNHIPFFWPSVISGILVVALGILVTPVYGLLGIISVRFLVQISFSNWYSVYLDLKLLNWNPKNYISEFPKMGIRGVYKNVSRFLNLDERKKRNAA
ncbi:MAG: hypothetical protein HC905_11595 [Bacteroidales bacterium]|nr:hypothetical protein [Bacteroidales bacterium]